MTPDSSVSGSQYTLLAIEAGGTTFKLGTLTTNHLSSLPALLVPPKEMKEIDTELESPLENVTIVPTTTPSETMDKIRVYCENLLQKVSKIDAVGIACFGPVQLNHQKENYGFITSTPKELWRNFDIVSAVRNITKCERIAFDTDVNAPALVEAKVSGLSNVAYITIGTGVGVGLVINGTTVTGLVHPEGGHMYVPREENDNFDGVCSFHKCCVEGMVNSVAIKERCNLSDLSQLKDLSDDNPVWETVAHYIAHLCLNILLLTSVERILLGGGVMERKCLFPKVRDRFTKYLNAYVRHDDLESGMDKYISEPVYGGRAGLAGAFALAFGEIQ